MDQCIEEKVRGAAPWKSNTCCLGEGEPALLPTSTQMFKQTPQNSRRSEPDLGVATSPPPVPDRVPPKHLQQQRMNANLRVGEMRGAKPAVSTLKKGLS